MITLTERMIMITRIHMVMTTITGMGTTMITGMGMSRTMSKNC